MVKGHLTSLVCKKFISVRNRVPGLGRLSGTVNWYGRAFVERLFANEIIIVCDCMKNASFSQINTTVNFWILFDLYESKLTFVESSTKADWLALKALWKHGDLRWNSIMRVDYHWNPSAGVAKSTQIPTILFYNKRVYFEGLNFRRSPCTFETSSPAVSQVLAPWLWKVDTHDV